MQVNSDNTPALKFETKQGEEGFCKFFHGLPEKPANTIRIFERNSGEYYSVHGEDTLYVAKNVFKTSTGIKYLGGDEKKGIPSYTLSKFVLESFLRDCLLNNQMKIELWSNGTKKNNEWQITKQASPGNIQELEDLLFSNTEVSSSPVILCARLIIKDNQKIVGLAYADSTRRELGVSEFTVLIQLGVKECIITTDDKDHEILKLKADFSTKNIEQDLNRLLGKAISVTSLPEFKLENAMSACACIINYLSLLSDQSNFGNYSLRLHDISKFMRLDASAISALNLFSTKQDGTNAISSLYGLLNKCVTSQGSRLLCRWLKQPLMNKNEIEQRHDLVEIFVTNIETLEDLKNTPDLHRLTKRFRKQNSNLQDVLCVYNVVQKLPELITALESLHLTDDKLKNLAQETYIMKFKKFESQLVNYKTMVEEAIDLEAAEEHKYKIREDHDEGLKAIKMKMNKIKERIKSCHNEASDDLNFNDKNKLYLETHKSFGYCFRISRKDAPCINRNKKYIELSTQRNGVYFTTTEMKDLNEKYEELDLQYAEEQSSLEKEVLLVAATYCSVLEKLNELIAHIDVIVRFVIFIEVDDIINLKNKNCEKEFILKNARHPCIEVQDNGSFIPNDVNLIRGTREFQIVTGPNMGGKSTYIRQIGVIALMAQAGCFVPCSEASICIFDCILARVGAGDSYLQGVSTFMAEMLETTSILRTATENSLIIIDELGRGTSTYDGFGLAWAISEYIATNIRCFCMFATHFHELTVLSDQMPNVCNLHVTVHTGRNSDGESEITLLYKVIEGVCDESFGIHVAELANFPETVLRLARKKINILEDSTKNKDEMDIDQTNTSKQDIEGGMIIKEFFKEVLEKTEDLSDYNSILSCTRSIFEQFKDRIESNSWCVAYLRFYNTELSSSSAQ
nr:9493_t:CDS:10 [Entrophospora candida]